MTDYEDNPINITTFIQQMTQCIKIGIYLNKGTDKDDILEKCIKLYNKYIPYTVHVETDEDMASIRRCLKRLNLILKVNENGTPVDIRDKTNQIKILHLSPHPSIINDKMESMIEYTRKYNIDIFSGIPLLFLIRESKYQELIWQHIRSLFYITQVVLSSIPSDNNQQDIREKISSNSLDMLEEILLKISDIDNKLKLNQLIAADQYLSRKLESANINSATINKGKDEVKEIFRRKGIDTNSSSGKMIDIIADKLRTTDLTGGNIINNMMGIAQTVVQEMKNDLENDPTQIQNSLQTILGAFSETVNNAGEEVPHEIKNLFNNLVENPNIENQEDILQSLNSLIDSNGLDRDIFYQSIIDESGNINSDKLNQEMLKLEYKP